MSSRSLALGISIGAVMALSPEQALANPSCGAVLTQNTTLDGNMSCSDSALVIGKRGVTLDLGGFTLSGPGPFLAYVGVSSTAQNATIKNGTISQFGTNVSIGPKASRNVVTGLSSTDGVTGLKVESRANEISSNFIANNQLDGIRLEGSSSNLVSGNLIGGNSTFYSSTCGNDVGAADIFIGPGSNANTIGPNPQMGETAGDGIHVASGSSRNVITGNVGGADCDDGIDIRSPKTTVTGNTSVNNIDYGIFAVAGVTDGGSNFASNNGTNCTSNISC